MIATLPNEWLYLTAHFYPLAIRIVYDISMRLHGKKIVILFAILKKCITFVCNIKNSLFRRAGL